MKKNNLLKAAFLLFAVIAAGGQNFKALGQSSRTASLATVPIDCSSVGDVLTLGSTNTDANNSTSYTTFYKFDPANAATTANNIIFTIPYATNSLGYNPVDGFYYAFPTGNVTKLLKIDAQGNVTEITVSGVTTSNVQGSGFRGGTIDANGIMYLVPAGNASSTSNALYYLDLTLAAPVIHSITVTGGGSNIGMPDIVWDPTGNANKLYGFEVGGTNNGGLDVITLTYSGRIPQSGVLNRPGPAYNQGTPPGSASTPGTDSTTINFGAAFLAFPDGTLNSEVLYAWNNGDGNFYIYNITTGVRTGPITTNFGKNISINDGASCPSLWSDIQVTKADTLLSLMPGATTTYKIVVTNDGPSDAHGVQVIDSLPAGITNMTSTATADAGVTATILTSGTQTGMLNDNISLLPVGKSITYKVTVTVPAAGYTNPKLTNIVTVKPNNTILDPDLTNNSAYDVDNVNPPILPVNPNIRVKILKN